MGNVLLFLHFIGFAITIGAALYDRFYIVRNIRLARNSTLERHLIRIYLSTAPLFGVGVALILLSGIGLTLMHKAGFFQLSAVGLKQFLFVAIGLVFPVYIIPVMMKIHRLLDITPDEHSGVSNQCRDLLKRLSLVLDAIMVTNIVILAIAVWKPDLGFR